MSDSELNKADGCDVFFSLLIVIVLLSGFFIFKALTEPDAPLEVDHKTSKLEKIKLLHTNLLTQHTKLKLILSTRKIIPPWKNR